MAFTRIFRGISLIPTGRTPRFLSNGINPQATKGARIAGSTSKIARHQSTDAKALRKPTEASPKEEHNAAKQRHQHRMDLQHQCGPPNYTATIAI